MSSIRADELQIGTTLGNGCRVNDIHILDDTFVAYSWRSALGEPKCQAIRRDLQVVHRGGFSMSALFVASMDDGSYVNLARATALRVTPSRHTEGFVVLAHFSGRTVVVGHKPTEAEAHKLCTSLAARANAGEGA